MELALGLIDTVDETTRAMVAARLGSYPAAPAAILTRLSSAPAPAAHPNNAADTGSANLLATFFAATAEERRLILLNHDATTTAAQQPAPVFAEVIKRLENAALQRNAGEFSRTLARALNIPMELAERITRDPSGEPIVIAAKSLGMKAAILQRVLLFINPVVGQSVQRVFDLALLFDELTREGAENMLEVWRKAGSSGESSRPSHQPLYHDDETGNARTQASPAPRRAMQDQSHALADERSKSTR